MNEKFQLVVIKTKTKELFFIGPAGIEKEEEITEIKITEPEELPEGMNFDTNKFFSNEEGVFVKR